MEQKVLSDEEAANKWRLIQAERLLKRFEAVMGYPASSPEELERFYQTHPDN